MNQHWLPFDIPIGTGVGTVVGILVGDIALGIARGAGTGVAVGSVCDFRGRGDSLEVIRVVTAEDDDDVNGYLVVAAVAKL